MQREIIDDQHEANPTTNKGQTDDTCSICLDSISPEGQSLSLPGCGHRFHVACVLTMSQYSIRCPVCRQVPQGVGIRQTTLQAQLDQSQQARRRYIARRRTLLKRMPEMANKTARLKDLRSDMSASAKELHKLYSKKCESVWKTDAEVAELKGTLRRMRRQELRLERQLQAVLEPLIGHEPPCIVVRQVSL